MNARTHPTRAARAHAFTLIEVLIATGIFALVLAGMNAAFYAALRLHSTTSRVLEEAMPLNHALARMRADLRGIMVPGGTLAGAFTGVAQSAGNSQLTVHTTTGVLDEQQPWGQYQGLALGGLQTRLQPWGDIQRVTYSLRSPMRAMAGPGRDLVREVTRNLLAPIQLDLSEQTLLTGVEFFHMSYYDGATWRDTWDSTNSDAVVPQAIRVRVDFAARDRIDQRPMPLELVVPLMMQPSTNSTSTQSTGTTGGGQ
jgi:type II secretion system protein J